jgi:hypothetical protein
MPKDRSKTYSDRQSDASRGKKVKPGTKQPPKKKVPREDAGQAAAREGSRSL